MEALLICPQDYGVEWEIVCETRETAADAQSAHKLEAATLKS